MPARSRIRIGPRAGVLIALGLLVSLEGVLRFGFGFPLNFVTETSARYGWRPLPDQVVRGRDSGVLYRINDWGYRDEDFGGAPGDARERDPRVLTVAVVGNSVAFGNGLDARHAWPEVLEAELQRRLDAAEDPRRARTLNFARQGYTLDQMAAVALDEALPLAPDVLVVPLFAYDVRPYVPEPDPPRYPLRRLLLRTATYDFLNRIVLGNRRELFGADPAYAGGALDAFSRAAGDDPFHPSVGPAWGEARRRLEALRTAAGERGTRLLVAAMAEPRDLVGEARPQRSATRWEPWCAERPDVLFVDVWPAFRAHLDAASEALAGRAATDAEIDAVRPWIPGDPKHLSALGHGLVARAVADALASGLALGGPGPVSSGPPAPTGNAN